MKAGAALSIAGILLLAGAVSLGRRRAKLAAVA